MNTAMMWRHLLQGIGSERPPIRAAPRDRPVDYQVDGAFSQLLQHVAVQMQRGRIERGDEVLLLVEIGNRPARTDALVAGTDVIDPEPCRRLT